MKVLALVMILLIGCAILGVAFAGHLEKIGCSILSESKLKDHCFQDAAVRLSMPSVCYMVKGYDWNNEIGNPPQAKCFRRIAVKEKDPFICYKIKEGHPNAETQAECFAEVAYATSNSAYCDMIEQNISRGFGMFALTKESCYSKVGSAPRYCEGVDEKELTKCMTKSAVEFNNIALCEKIVNKDEQKTCVFETISELYSSQMLKEYSCDNINDPNLKYPCILNTASLLESKGTCNKILETNWKQICTLMTDLSSKEFDETYTQKDLEEYTKKCDVFTAKGKSMCLILIGSELEGAADNSGDIELQDKVAKDAIQIMIQGTLEVKEDNIFTPIAIIMIGKRLKPEFCESYSGEIRDNCLYLAAVDTGDCSKITETKLRSECKSEALPLYKIQIEGCKDYPDKEECKTKFKYWVALKMNEIQIPEELEKIFGK